VGGIVKVPPSLALCGKNDVCERNASLVAGEAAKAPLTEGDALRVFVLETTLGGEVSDDLR
jgi:hypothetical protein